MSIDNLYAYNRDVFTITKYGEDKVKICLLSSCRVSGFEVDSSKYVPKGSVNDCKLDNNISRAKSKVYEYIMCNPWEYWCTFTLSPEKYDRFNLKKFHKDLSEFIHTLNRSRISKISYILVPEMHKDGAWHMHGFLNGLLDSDLVPTGHYDKKGNAYFTWGKYNAKFGYMSIDKVDNLEAMAKYCIKKYITKKNSGHVSELGSHFYYASHGLKTGKRIYKGQGILHAKWDYVSPDGYVKVCTLDLKETTLEECFEVLC